jgi:CheY-like chemotaxis protein
MTPKPRVKKSLTSPDLTNKHILVAEDNAINKVLIETMLRSTKATVTLVGNGQLAVNAVQTQSFDVVLMDIHMPLMDGMEAQQKIKRLNPDLPVIALTANVMKEDVDSYLQKGFVAHVAKPIDINDLYDNLKYYLS